MKQKLRHFLVAAMAVLSFGLISCADNRANTNGVYLLIDTSGTYVEQLDKARKIINYLLANLNSGDSLAVARVSSKSFSEKDIVAKVTFDRRPSQANLEKRAFNQKVEAFSKSIQGSSYTDITGGLLQAAEFLNEADSGKKTVIIFSDMQEELDKSTVRDFPINLKGIRVMAVNVIKLNTDNTDPRRYMDRLSWWEKRVRDAGATDWVVINDLENLDRILGARRD